MTPKKLDVYVRRFLLRRIYSLIGAAGTIFAVLGFLVGYNNNGSAVNSERITTLELRIDGTSDYVNSTYRFFSEIRAEARQRQDEREAERAERLMRAAEIIIKNNEVYKNGKEKNP